jgi:predicted ABC-type ATPase
VGSLLVVTGPPGAGKSTVAPLLAADEERSTLVQGDAFFGFLARGAIAPWLPESQEQNAVVTRAMAAAVGELVRGGYATVFDGVLGPWFVPTFLGGGGLDGLAIDYLVLLPPVEVCVERVAARVDHGFSDEAATRHMHAQFADSDVDDRHVIHGDAAPHLVLELVRTRRARGDLTLRPA